MKKKIVWLVISSLMALSLVLASCAPEVTEEKVVTEEKKVGAEEKKVVTEEKKVAAPGKGMVTVRVKKHDGTEVEITKEKPRRGGTMVEIVSAEWSFPDPSSARVRETALNPILEDLVTAPWERGPAGTGEWRGLVSLFIAWGEETGALAESYEVIPPDTILFHIRRGVHWTALEGTEASKLMGGREFTADDVVFSIRFHYRPGGWQFASNPYLADMVNLEKSVYLDPNDPWTVVVKADPKSLGGAWEAISAFMHMKPPEIVQKYGELRDWPNVAGTGAFIMKDVVRGSSMTWVRNPNYWGKNPLHPEDEIPYLDGFKMLVIPDPSTQEAAMRTGKADKWNPAARTMLKDQTESLLKTAPQLQSLKYLSSGIQHVAMRTDLKPYNDIRVRHALTMALNYRELIDSYYAGDAELLAWPIAPLPEQMAYYTPLEKYPQSVQELFTYNPDKARKLLAEAGYPKGFPNEIILEVGQVDMVSIVKAQWAKVGVDLTLRVVEPAVYSLISYQHGHQQMMFASRHPSAISSLWAYVPGTTNPSKVNEPWLKELRKTMYDNYFNTPKRFETVTNAAPRMLEEAWYILLPVPYEYRFWQPWLKDHNGVSSYGITGDAVNYKYYWLDQDLKQEMTRGR